MDLSRLVSGGGKLSGAYGDLASKIGESAAVFSPSLGSDSMADLLLQPSPR